MSRLVILALRGNGKESFNSFSLGGEKVRTRLGLCGIIERCELKVLKSLRRTFLDRLPQSSGNVNFYLWRELLQATDVLATKTQTKAVAGGRDRNGHQGLGWQGSNRSGLPEPLFPGYVQLGFPDGLPPSQPANQCSLREILSTGIGGHGRCRLGSWAAFGGKPEAHGRLQHCRFFTGL
jgi:hypothetical protein